MLPRCFGETKKKNAALSWSGNIDKGGNMLVKTCGWNSRNGLNGRNAGNFLTVRSRQAVLARKKKRQLLQQQCEPSGFSEFLLPFSSRRSNTYKEEKKTGRKGKRKSAHFVHLWGDTQSGKYPGSYWLYFPFDCHDGDASVLGGEQVVYVFTRILC